MSNGVVRLLENRFSVHSCTCGIVQLLQWILDHGVERGIHKALLLVVQEFRVAQSAQLRYSQLGFACIGIDGELCGPAKTAHCLFTSRSSLELAGRTAIQHDAEQRARERESGSRHRTENRHPASVERSRSSSFSCAQEPGRGSDHVPGSGPSGSRVPASKASRVCLAVIEYWS